LCQCVILLHCMNKHVLGGITGPYDIIALHLRIYTMLCMNNNFGG